MSQQSSINFKKSFAINAEHNDRTLPPSYLIDNEKGAECNRTAQEARELKNQIIDDAINTYTNRTNQKFQAKSYEWSAVVNIKPNTTMQDLEALAKHFNDKYGFQCYQIAIHRDEGHINEQGEKQINHHAHLEFITLDKQTGKTNFKMRDFTKEVMREIQSETAEILQMQRGVDKRISKVERIEPRKYAQIKEQEKKTKSAELETNLNKPLTKKEAESTIKAFIQNTQDDKQSQLISLFQEVKKTPKAEFTETSKTLQKKIENIIGDNQTLKKELERLKQQLKELEAEKSAHEQTKTELISQKQIKERLEQERKAYIAENEALKQENKELKYNADDYKALRELNKKQFETIQALEAEILRLKEEKEQKDKKQQELEKENQALRGQISPTINERHQDNIKVAEKQKNQIQLTLDDLEAVIRMTALRRKEIPDRQNKYNSLYQDAKPKVMKEIIDDTNSLISITNTKSYLEKLSPYLEKQFKLAKDFISKTTQWIQERTQSKEKDLSR